MSALAKSAHRPPDIALILGTHKPATGDDEDDDKGGDTDQDQAENDAAESMMEAMKKDDVAGFKKALCAFIDLYKNKDGDEDEEDEG